MGLLLPPILFLPLFFAYSFLTLHLSGWKIISVLNNKDSRHQIMNSNSVSMPWKSTFSIRALEGLNIWASLELSTWPSEQAGISVTNLYSARPKTKPLCLSKLLGQCPLFQSKKIRGEGDDRFCKEVVSWFSLMYVQKYANVRVSWGRGGCISQLRLERSSSPASHHFGFPVEAHAWVAAGSPTGGVQDTANWWFSLIMDVAISPLSKVNKKHI